MKRCWLFAACKTGRERMAADFGNVMPDLII